jgi:hypothetical protein
MSSRIEIEITSAVDAKSFTWRAVGAREPKGTIQSAFLPSSVQVGEIFRVEADFLLDGIEIIRVLPKKTERSEPVLLEVIGTKKSESGVTSSLASKKKQQRGKKGKSAERSVRKRNESTKSADKPKTRKENLSKKISSKKRVRNVNKPRGKRLKPKKVHRNQIISGLPELHQPLAKEVLVGGVPKLRDLIRKMELPPGFDVELLKYAEDLNTELKTAEWLDRAEAVLNSSADVDLRDFRSVVAAADRWARSDALKEKRSELEKQLHDRILSEHKRWLIDIGKAIHEEKSVRALNLSSHPPKPGTPLPEALSEKLIELANSALSSSASPSRWEVVLQAVAYSPIRLKVVPEGLPDKPTAELISTIRRLKNRIPEIAKLFSENGDASTRPPTNKESVRQR